MKKVVIALLILTIAIFAAIKGALWYQTEQFVEQQINLVKPFADISYKEIKSTFSGTATVDKVKIYIPLIDETIYIDSIQFLTPDFMTLLTLDKQLNNKQIPESLSLLINGAALDLNGNLMKIIDDPKNQPTQLELFATLACGDTLRIGSQALTKMGYDNITSDLVLRYQFIPAKNLINFSIRNHLRDMTHFNLSGELHNVSDLDSLTKGTARPGKFTLEIVDDSYIERKNRFCAKQGQRTLEEYIEAHTKQIKEYLLSYGVRPEEGLLNAYRTVIETSGTIVFEADLQNLTGLEELQSFEPNDIIQLIRLNLFVNNERINEISINIDKDKLIETATSDDIDLETPEQIERKRLIIVKKYRPIAPANLKNFNGYRVKIETTKGKQYKGNINTANPRVYEIVTRLRSGNVSYFVPVNQIKKAEVFH